MSIKRATPEDPRGVIAESYHIDGLSLEDARVIFLGWAMIDALDNMQANVEILLKRYEAEFPTHPMTLVLSEGARDAQIKGTRRGRRSRNS